MVDGAHPVMLLRRMAGFLFDGPSQARRGPASCYATGLNPANRRQLQWSDVMDDFEGLLGRAVFQLWPDLPRDIQECIFEAASSDPDIRRRLAVVLHDQHPKTAFPPQPSALA
jgi:hypothetical protein